MAFSKRGGATCCSHRIVWGQHGDTRETGESVQFNPCRFLGRLSHLENATICHPSKSCACHTDRGSRVADRTHLEDLFSISQASKGHCWMLIRNTGMTCLMKPRAKRDQTGFKEHLATQQIAKMWGYWPSKAKKLAFYLSHLNGCFATHLHQIPWPTRYLLKKLDFRNEVTMCNSFQV